MALEWYTKLLRFVVAPIIGVGVLVYVWLEGDPDSVITFGYAACGAVTFLATLASADLLELLMDLEYNTRKMREGVQ